MRTSPLADFPEVAWRKENERQAVSESSPKGGQMSTEDTGGTPDDPVADHEAIRVGPGSDWKPDEKTPLTPKQEEIARTIDEDHSGYDEDDPKHPTWRERLAAIWDSRPGK